MKLKYKKNNRCGWGQLWDDVLWSKCDELILQSAWTDVYYDVEIKISEIIDRVQVNIILIFNEDELR